MHTLFGKHWRNTIPPETDHWLSYWLDAPGSLTKSIQQVCTKAFRVKVLLHEFSDTPTAAPDTLQLAAGDRVLHREVLLCDAEVPLVFACSLLPEKALHGRFAALKDMGSRPLGHWIFQEPVLQRSEMQFTALAGNDPLFARLEQLQTGIIYGRKTLFSGAAQPFLVSEFFLPALRNKVLGPGQTGE